MCANFWPSRRPRRARKGACHHEWAPTPTHPFSSPSPSPSLALALRVRRKIKGSRSGHTNAIPSGVTSSRQVSHLFPFLRVVPHTRTHTAHRGARTSDLLFAPPTAEHQVRSALKVVARDALTPGWRAAPRRGARYALCATGVRTHHRAPPHQLAARGGDSPLTRGRRPAKMQLSLHFTQVSAARAAHTARHPPKKQKKGPVTHGSIRPRRPRGARGAARPRRRRGGPVPLQQVPQRGHRRVVSAGALGEGVCRWRGHPPRSQSVMTTAPPGCSPTTAGFSRRRFFVLFCLSS